MNDITITYSSVRDRFVGSIIMPAYHNLRQNANIAPPTIISNWDVYINAFKQWKDDPDRKLILLKDARQIGKTWAMETFGRECFDYFVKFDFDRQSELKSVFHTTKSLDRLLKDLALYCEQPIDPGKTQIIFDEIQECEERSIA